jgi:prefoldin beta subunit
MVELSPQLQNRLAQYQQLQRQIQIVATQKYQFEAQLSELEHTLDELKKLESDTTIYKNIGPLLVKVNDRPNLEKELNDLKETLTIKIKTLERQEEHLRERFQTLQQQLQQALKVMDTGVKPGVST